MDILDFNSDELSGTPVALLLDNDNIEDISDLPENTDPSKSTYNLDLSEPNLLKLLIIYLMWQLKVLMVQLSINMAIIPLQVHMRVEV